MMWIMWKSAWITRRKYDFGNKNITESLRKIGYVNQNPKIGIDWMWKTRCQNYRKKRYGLRDGGN